MNNMKLCYAIFYPKDSLLFHNLCSLKNTLYCESTMRVNFKNKRVYFSSYLPFRYRLIFALDLNIFKIR